MLVSYLKLVALSLVAVALAACARLGLADADQFRSPPRFGQPPAGEPVEPAQPPETLDTLQARLDALDAQIINLRRAVEIMNPPARAQEFLVAGGAPGDPELYAPPPALPLAQSMFAWAESCTTFVAPPVACRPVEARAASR